MLSKRVCARMCAIGVSAAALVAVGVPGFAATGSGTTPTFTVNYTVGTVAFDGPGCVQVPLAIDYTLVGAPNGYVTLDLGFARSNSPVSGFIIVTAPQDPPSGRRTSEVTYCPASYLQGKGPLRVTGTVVSPRGGASAQLTPSTATVVQNPVRMIRARVATSLGSWVVAGAVEARTLSRGWVGAGGVITIQLRRPGSARWVSGETVGLDQFGSWRTVAPISTTTYPRGTAFRAVLTGCNWCRDSSLAGTLR